jgi:7,8-dihydropterin-6-yl-methyl-4-(beta-D-ribofuranosyl)aminobenzene 5'-phosphate synthase
MNFRLSPLWWSVLAVASPIAIPWLLIKNQRFQQKCVQAAETNQIRLSQATPLDMPELDFLELKVLVEWQAEAGFISDAGVSYLFRTNLGTLLFDVGFGPTRPALTHNAAKLSFSPEQMDALTISHLHPDHMGGIPAYRTRQVTVPDSLLPPESTPCFLPDQAQAGGFNVTVVEKPRMLAAGMASSGPLARSLFFLGYTEEQALIARIKNIGLVVFTGCGHPTMEVILRMVKRLSNEPLYAIGGGLHFPVTGGRGNRAGIQIQTILGTGKPPWRRITDEDLSQTIDLINEAGAKKVFLSGHDSCDHSLERMKRELKAETEALKAGAIYRF